MLKAFKSELQRLRKEEYAFFHAQIRGRVGKRATRHFEEPLVQQVMLIPDLMGRIHHYWEQPYMPARVKRLASWIFAYLYNNEDVLPTKEHGLFGYLDDAYLVGLFYECVLHEVRSQYLPVAETDIQLAEHTAKNLGYIRKIIPDTTDQIDRMFEEVLQDNYRYFAEAVTA